MLNLDLHLPPAFSDDEIVELLDGAIAKAGLTTSMRASLKSFPDSTHWHVKNGREKGTLEITYWPAENRAWFSIQDGRRASWIDGKLTVVQDLILRHDQGG